VQHEVFGHGSRIREYGGRDITYELHLPMPYDVGGGLTSWNYSTPVSNDEEIAVTIGGVEASALLSGHLIDHCVQRGKISSREAFLYTLASNDVTYYLWRTQREGSHGESNDMSSYEDAVNAREGFSENHKLTIDDLARQNIISKFLDPFQYIALFTFLKTYLWDGENSCDLPMISLGNVKYLPAFRFGLAPFGSEVYLDNYFVRSERVLKFSLRYGIPTFQHSWGIGCSVANLLQTEFVSLGGSLDLWNQPFLEGFIGSHTLPRSGTGKAVSINAKFKLIDTFASIHVITEIRTKTAGYLQGEPLSDAFLWRAGLQVVTR
jgi:hypothetical protein